MQDRELLEKKIIYPSSQSVWITRWINKQPVQSLKTIEPLTGPQWVTLSMLIFSWRAMVNWIPVTQDRHNIHPLQSIQTITNYSTHSLDGGKERANNRSRSAMGKGVKTLKRGMDDNNATGRCISETDRIRCYRGLPRLLKLQSGVNLRFVGLILRLKLNTDSRLWWNLLYRLDIHVTEVIIHEIHGFMTEVTHVFRLPLLWLFALHF